jgi:Zn-dependent protease
LSDDPYNVLIKILIFAPSMILAITLHEAAHGYVAKHFGDTTAYMLGRVTLNPIKHIDLVGTIVVPLLIGFATNWSFLFGWAKPVPVNFNNLRHPKRDMLWVAAAGPGSNLLQAALWATLAMLLASLSANSAATYWFSVAEAGILVNVVFAILNLFPILPLDGGRILASVLPNKLSYAYQGTERFGMIILIALIVTGILGKLLSPLVYGTVVAIYSLFGLQ